MPLDEKPTDPADAPVHELRQNCSEQRVASERAAQRSELRARDRKLAEAESKLAAVQRRLATYRRSPHLALQDLGDVDEELLRATEHLQANDIAEDQRAPLTPTGHPARRQTSLARLEEILRRIL